MVDYWVTAGAKTIAINGKKMATKIQYNGKKNIAKTALEGSFSAVFAIMWNGSNLFLSANLTIVNQLVIIISLVGISIMAKKWQRTLRKTLVMPTRRDGKYPYKEPFLSKPDNDDLSKQWVIEYGAWSVKENRIKRKRVVLSAPTVDERLADAKFIIETLTKKLEAGHHLDPVEGKKPKESVSNESYSDMPILKAIKQYLDVVKTHLTNNSYSSYRSSLGALEEYLEKNNLQKTTLGSFTRADAIMFLDYIKTVQKNSNRTRNNRKADCITFYNYFIDRDRKKGLTDNPFLKIAKLPQPRHKHTAYSSAQRKTFLEYCEKHGHDDLLLFCQFIYYTFIRSGDEMRELRVRHIFEDTIQVTAESAKDNETEYVIIPKPLEELIQRYKLRDYQEDYYLFTATGQPGPKKLGKNTMYNRCKRILKKIGITDTRHDLYCWKHTGAIALWDATKNIELIRRQCRHSDIKQTIDYLKDLGKLTDNSGQIHQFPEF